MFLVTFVVRLSPKNMSVTRVRRSFFEQEPLEVGRSLIGMELGSDLSGSRCGGLIVETEVYIGPEDRAAHSWNTRRTARTEVMYGPRGHAYVFQIYGMHYCFNIVVGPGRVPAAVLVRALRPTFGLDVMAKNRGLPVVPANLRQLTSGPGRLAQALVRNDGQFALQGEVLTGRMKLSLGPGQVFERLFDGKSMTQMLYSRQNPKDFLLMDLLKKEKELQRLRGTVVE